MRQGFKDNAFDLIRLYAAIQVMLSHYVGILGWKLPYVINEAITLFSGVTILFLLSGYVVAASAERTKTIDFYTKRFCRIFPSYWMAVILSSVMVLFFATERTFSGKEILKWTITQMAGFAYTPSFLENYGTGSANGVLWCIPVLIQFYILIAIVLPWLNQKSEKTWHLMLVVTALISVVFSQEQYFQGYVLGKPMNVWISRTILQTIHIFYIGVYFYHFRDKLVEFSKKWFFVFIPVLYIYNEYIVPIPLIDNLYVKADFISTLLLAFITIGISYRIGHVRLKYEISMGIFLYHIVFLNVFVEHNMTNSIWNILGLFLCVTLAAFVNLMYENKVSKALYTKISRLYKS